jgi:hypothetical protein
MERLNRKPTMSRRIDRVVSAESFVVLFVSGRIIEDLKNVLLVRERPSEQGLEGRKDIEDV